MPRKRHTYTTSHTRIHIHTYIHTYKQDSKAQLDACQHLGKLSNDSGEYTEASSYFEQARALALEVCIYVCIKIYVYTYGSLIVRGAGVCVGCGFGGMHDMHACTHIHSHIHIHTYIHTYTYIHTGREQQSRNSGKVLDWNRKRQRAF